MAQYDAGQSATGAAIRWPVVAQVRLPRLRLRPGVVEAVFAAGDRRDHLRPGEIEPPRRHRQHGTNPGGHRRAGCCRCPADVRRVRALHDRNDGVLRTAPEAAQARGSRGQRAGGRLEGRARGGGRDGALRQLGCRGQDPERLWPSRQPGDGTRGERHDARVCTPGARACRRARDLLGLLGVLVTQRDSRLAGQRNHGHATGPRHRHAAAPGSSPSLERPRSSRPAPSCWRASRERR